MNDTHNRRMEAPFYKIQRTTMAATDSDDLYHPGRLQKA